MNPFANRSLSLSGPATDTLPVVPDDTIDLPHVAVGLYTEAGGAISQTASLIGAHGLSVLALFVFSAPAALSGRGPRLAREIPLVMGVGLLLASWGYGITRLSGADDIARTDNQVLLVSLNLPRVRNATPPGMTFWNSIWP